MHYVRHFKHLGKEDVRVAGGKGAQLGEMSKAGIPVPPGFVVLTSAFELFVQENGLKQKIAGELAKVNPKKTESVNKASEKIRSLILDSKFSPLVGDAVLTEFDSLAAQYVAVRSSATAEDAKTASWAGELDTYVNIQKNGVLEAVKKCWSSLFTPRAIFYRFEKNMGAQDISVAVVIQKMVQSEVSGVAFTVHPVTKDLNQIIIEAGYGLGESVVAGLITPDNYVVDKKDLLILDATVNKQEKMIKKIGVETKHLEVPSKLQEKQKLAGKTILELAEICKKIENHYGTPQDIEFAIEGKNIYIVQTRPVTTL